MGTVWRGMSIFHKATVVLVAAATAVAVVLLAFREKAAREDYQLAIGNRYPLAVEFSRVVQGACERISGQEAAGRALAVALEAAGPPTAGKTRELIAQRMKTADSRLRGLGAIADADPGASGGPAIREYAFRHPDGVEWLGGDDAWASFASRFPAGAFGETGWTGWCVTTRPPAGDGAWAASALLLLPARSGAFHGRIAVEMGVRWLEDALAALAAMGNDFACCVSPDGRVFRIDGGRLVFSTPDAVSVDGLPLFEPGDPPETPSADVAAKARRFASGFWAVDLLDSGWILAARPAVPARSAEVGWGVVALLLFLAFLSLVVDYFAPSAGPEAADVLCSRSLFDAMDASGDEVKSEKTGREKRSTIRALLRRLAGGSADAANRVRTQSELRVARQIQFSLIPSRFPQFSEWREFDLYSLLSPQRHVGGDYYDFFMRDVNRIVIVVGDVSGKGVPAAIYMAVCRTAFRAIALQSQRPGELLTRLNDQLIRDNQSGMFITLACFFIDLPTGNCQYALGGHTPPVLHRRGAQGGQYIEDPHETFVGQKAGARYPDGELRLFPGDSLFLYTDGLPESKNAKGEYFGYDRVKPVFVDNSLKSATCRDLVDGVEADFRAFLDGRDPDDDVTAFAFRYWGPGGRRTGLSGLFDGNL